MPTTTRSSSFGSAARGAVAGTVARTRAASRARRRRSITASDRSGRELTLMALDLLGIVLAIADVGPLVARQAGRVGFGGRRLEQVEIAVPVGAAHQQRGHPVRAGRADPRRHVADAQ